MKSQPTKICVVVPTSLGYSETFLQAHVDRLAAAVSYPDCFPIDVDAEFPNNSSLGLAEQLKRCLRRGWHKFILNPIKTIHLARFFRKHKIDIVLAEYGMIGTAVFPACKKLRIPLVVHFHGSDAHTHDVVDHYKHQYRQIFDYASAIIAVSRHMVEQLVNLGAQRDKVFYNPYSVDTDKFQQDDRVTAPLQAIAVGRFVEKKAPYLTILAFAKVLQRLPAAKLVMVGTGALHDVCHKLVQSLHLESSIELKGSMTHDQVAEEMRRSRVFVQHSLVPASGDCEGTPVAILEAGACGLPVVSTRHAGIIDAVVHDKTGYLVEEGDIDMMAEYLYRLLSNVELAKEMGRNARTHIRENFSKSNLENLRRILETSSSGKTALRPASSQAQTSTVPIG